MSNESRYRQYDLRRLPKEKRTRRIWGAASYIGGRVVGDQSDNLYRCWNCGFVCNSDRDKTGDGVGYKVTDEVDQPVALNLGGSAHEFPNSDNTRDVKLCFDTIHDIHLVALDSAGDLQTVVHNNTQVVTSGCPLCGSRNYK